MKFSLKKGFIRYPVLGIFTTLLVGFMLTVNAAAPSDGEILNILKTANDAEVDAGKLASSKAENSKVREFAGTMVKEHTMNNDMTTKLATKGNLTLQENDASKAIKTDADSKMADLSKTVSTKDFDRTYMDQQIAMHKQVLTNLETNLIPSAQNKDVKAHLQKTKTHVQHHLSKATQIRGTLN